MDCRRRSAALLDRELLRVTRTPDGRRCLFTQAGLVALRAFLMRQPSDFRLPFPRIHRDLGLCHLVPPP